MGGAFRGNELGEQLRVCYRVVRGFISRLFRNPRISELSCNQLWGFKLANFPRYCSENGKISHFRCDLCSKEIFENALIYFNMNDMCKVEN